MEIVVNHYSIPQDARKVIDNKLKSLQTWKLHANQFSNVHNA